MDPKISICIPTYKQVDKLEVLLHSIDLQTFRDFEVIVSDDSPDMDVELLCKGNFSFNISYHRNIPAKGAPENWNHAISLAKGDWIKLMHHDDYFNLNSALQDYLDDCEENPLVDYFFCATNILDSNSGAQFHYDVNVDHVNGISEFPAFLFHKNLLGAPSTSFFKRSLKTQFDKKLIWLVDIEYYCRINSAYKIKFINSHLITTVISEEQLTTNLKNNREVEVKEFLYCYSKHISSFNNANRKLMRLRLLEIFKEFEVIDISNLKVMNLISPIPFFARIFLLSCRFSIPLSFKVFNKFNNSNIFRNDNC